jgi:hypothetical protein
LPREVSVKHDRESNENHRYLPDCRGDYAAAFRVLRRDERRERQAGDQRGRSSNKRSLVDDELGTPDWIELYNAGTDALDLSGYGVSDNMRNLHKFVMPEGTVLGAGEIPRALCTSLGDDQTTDALVTNFGLSKSGDYIFITDAYFGLVAQMEVPQLYTDVSYARAADGTYGYSGLPTPGAENPAQIYETLDAVFAAQNLDALSISEVMPTDDASGYRWVELKNNSEGAINLENYCLSDDEANPLKWQISSGTVPAGGYVCIYLSGLGKDGENGTHAAFRLSSEDTVLLLSDLQGNLIDRLEWQAGVPEGVSVVKDAAGMRVYTAYPTFAAENSAVTFYRPRDYGDGQERPGAYQRGAQV